MLGAAQLMVDFQGMHFTENEDWYINFQNHASIFCMATLGKMNDGGNVRCYVLLASVCATKKIIYQLRKYKVALNSNTPLQIL